VTHAPVRTLVNTHHHGDHTFGNALVAGATIVAHEATRDAMRVWGPPRDLPYWTPVEWGELELELPFLTFTDRVTSWVDDLQVEIRHVGTAAHTTNDSIVWVPERQVLFAGDLMFAGGTPFLVQGSVAGAIETLENVVRPLGATTIVAGHGPVSGPDLIETTLGYLRFVQHVAGDAVRSGVTPLDAARDLDLGEYANWSDAERIVGNLHRACAEANGAAPGAPIELPAALADMVTYNGGPLATHA
jgi:cyclase